MLTPAENYAVASNLMAKVAEMNNPALPISKAMTAQAAVYAALANYRDEPRIVVNHHNTQPTTERN